MPPFSPGLIRALFDRRGGPRRHDSAVLGSPPSTGSSVQASWRTARGDTGFGKTDRSVGGIGLAPMARVRLTFRWLSPVGRPYSSSLLCFLYCFDDDSRKRLKTVDSVPQRRCPGLRRLGGQAAGAAQRPMAVRIGYRETGLRRAEPAGGSRDPAKRVWIPQRDVAKRLELLPRRVGQGGKI